jgi:hypothetical protein
MNGQRKTMEQVDLSEIQLQGEEVPKLFSKIATTDERVGCSQWLPKKK